MGEEPISFPQLIDREILRLTYEHHEAKSIAEEIGISVSAVNARKRDICARAQVKPHELPVWVAQNPACAVKGSICRPGLHPANCLCGAPYCSARKFFAIAQASGSSPETVAAA